MANRTREETLKNIATCLGMVNTGLMMIGEAAETARVLEDALEEFPVKNGAASIARSMDTLGDEFRKIIDVLRESIDELRTAGNGDGTAGLG